MKHLWETYETIWILDTVKPFHDEIMSEELGPIVHKDQINAVDLKTNREISVTDLKTSPDKSLFKNALVITCIGTDDLAKLIENKWDLPKAVIDVAVEWRLISNGLRENDECDLLQIASSFNYSPRNFDAIIYGSHPYASLQAINYVFNELVNVYDINVDQALHRGRYIKALAQIHQNGVPIDYHRYCQLPTKQQIIDHYSKHFNVFSGNSICSELLANYCQQEGIDAQLNLSSNKRIKSKQLKQLSMKHPRLKDLYYISCLLQGSDTRLLYADPETYRNTANLRPFGTTTSRNNPKRSEFIFGHPKWMHSFIKPEKGTSLAYIDWNQQEFGIAAALSSDKKMIAAYESGDPYLQFAIDIGAIPEDATKHKYPEEREQYKNALLAILYGIGSESLGRMLSISNFQADQIIKQFQSCYRAYANWCYYQINQALFCCEIRTQFGWSRKISPDTRENSIKNFPIQTYGAELMRQATCILIESGIKVCTSVHDAFLIESSTTSIHKTVKKTKELMAQASRQVLDGFELTSDDEIISYPHRFSNDDQESIWNAAIPVIRRLGNG